MGCGVRDAGQGLPHVSCGSLWASSPSPLSPYRPVPQVKQYAGDVADLCLTFSVDDDFFGHTTSVREEGGRGLR